MSTNKATCPLAVMKQVIEIFPLFAAVDGLTYSHPDLREACDNVAELVKAARAASYQLRGETTADEALSKGMLDAALAAFPEADS